MPEVDINSNLKISAGPGAGKTTYLINHIKRVVKESPKLKKARKVACITYTNAAANTILERLDLNSDSVEVSTIHSFLYSNILKPYWNLVPDELGIDIKNVDGHEEIPLTKGLIYQWKKKTNQSHYLEDDKKIIKALKNISWEFNDDELVLQPLKTYLGKIGKYWIKKESYIDYKKLYWERGQLAHEDVLYLSYKLLNENPSIIRFLKAKFPYLFIDEFQDTSPLQYEILKNISTAGVTTGVIGDWGQAIYEFRGANPKLFQEISMEKMEELTIETNYRSCSNIVSLLNNIRSDITQTDNSEVENGHIKILVGDYFEAIDNVDSLIENKPCVLTRRNKEANLVNNEYGQSDISEYSSADNINIDSNSQRRLAIQRSIKSIIHVNNGQFKDAINELEKVIGSSIENDLEKKKAVLRILKYLVSNYGVLAELSLTDFVNRIKELYPKKITGLASGKAQAFYNQYKVKDVLVEIERSEPNKIAQTIHQSKGLEYESVLLLLGSHKNSDEFNEKVELGFLMETDLKNNEEHRIRYVGISRAIKNIFINIPSLTDSTEEKLKKLNFSIKRIK
jgi:DNA helicase-2/ATP-dependent DNA helicase PcrA